MRALDRGRRLAGSQGRARGEGGPSTPSSPSGPSWTARSQAAARIAPRKGSPDASAPTRAKASARSGRAPLAASARTLSIACDRASFDLRLVQDGEARRDVGLERDEVQQALAEGVQGLDLEAARRLHRPGEQAAGEPDLRRASGRSPERLGEVGGERRSSSSVTQRPSRSKMRIAMVGGRGLGEGEAEDAPRAASRRGAGASPGRSAPASCRRRRSPRPRRRRAGRRRGAARAASSRRCEGPAGPSRPVLLPALAGERPFLDPREMVVGDQLLAYFGYGPRDSQASPATKRSRSSRRRRSCSATRSATVRVSPRAGRSASASGARGRRRRGRRAGPGRRCRSVRGRRTRRAGAWRPPA